MLNVVYLFANFTISQYTDKKRIYYMDWSEIEKINPFSPIFMCVAFTFLSLSFHFFLCACTQLLHNRFESDFGNETKYKKDVDKKFKEDDTNT